MNLPVIYAKDSSPAAIAAAFGEQARRCPSGPLGPRGQTAIYIPGSVPAAGRRPVPSRPRATTVNPRAGARPSPPLGAARILIGAHPHSIGGYAAVFNQVSLRAGGVRELIRPGAFARALAAGGWFLLMNHAEGRPSLASTAKRTLHVEMDRYGLWFECSLPDDMAGARLADRVRRGACGVSIGSTSATGETVNGVNVLTDVAAWEISLLTPPNRSARAGTWVRPYAAALRERHRLGGM